MFDHRSSRILILIAAITALLTFLPLTDRSNASQDASGQHASAEHQLLAVDKTKITRGDFPQPQQQTLTPTPADLVAGRQLLLKGGIAPVATGRNGVDNRPDIPYPPDDSPAQTGIVAFESDRNGNFDIFSQQAGTIGGAVPLVAGSGNDVTPEWSPDGTKIVYASDRDGDFEIYVRAPGGQDQKLTNNTADDVHPAWSPAGDRIIFTSDRGGDYFQIYSMLSNGSGVQQIGTIVDNHAMHPRYSPDGGRVVFMRASVALPACQWNWDVWTMNANGSYPERVTTNLGADLYPRWLPNGSQIVYASCRNFLDFDLYTVNPVTGAERRLTSWFLANEWGASYTPNGQYLAFSTDYDGNTEIYTMPAAGGAAFNLTRHNANDLAPSWKPTSGGVVTPTPTHTPTPTPVAGYSISGRITDVSGDGISGVVISAGSLRHTIADGNGNYSFTGLPLGSYTITPSKPGYTFSPNPPSITVPPNATGVDFKGYDKLPIVFVHGWHGGDIRNWSCDWVEPDGYFQRVDNLLRDADYYVEYARLESSTCYTPHIEDNVWRLGNAIQLAKAATNQPRVILIAHSMGGLVARAYLEGQNYGEDVSQLFTFGTPHQGVPIDLLELFANGLPLATYCSLYQPAVCDFSYGGMWRFNHDYSARRGAVSYHVVSGAAPLFPRTPLGVVAYWLLYGPDDGAVQTWSGLGLSGNLDRWQTDEAHSNEVGPRNYFRRGEELSTSYLECLKRVLVDGATTSCSTFGPLDNTMDESPPPNQHTPFLHGTLLPGQITNLPIALEGGGALFVAQWQTGTVRVTLIDPVGQIIDPAYADAHPEIVTYHESAGYATYSFPNAATGLWQVRLQAVDVPSSGTAYTTFAAFEGALTLTGGTNRAWYSPGAAMVITATLSPPPQNANVTATILLVDATSTTVSLAPLGGGRYRSNYLVPTRAGYAEVRLRATGTNTNGKPFERGTSLAFQIAPDTVTLNGSYGDTPEPRWSGATIYDALAVNVGIDVSAAGAYGISADLVDVNGHQVAHASTITDLPSGVESLTLRFRGSDIHASQRNGPYRLTNLLLSDHGGAALVVQEAINVYTTAGYRFRDFRQGDLFLPLVNRSNWLH